MTFNSKSDFEKLKQNLVKEDIMNANPDILFLYKTTTKFQAN